MERHNDGHKVVDDSPMARSEARMTMAPKSEHHESLARKGWVGEDERGRAEGEGGGRKEEKKEEEGGVAKGGEEREQRRWGRREKRRKKNLKG